MSKCVLITNLNGIRIDDLNIEARALVLDTGEDISASGVPSPRDRSADFVPPMRHTLSGYGTDLSLLLFFVRVAAYDFGYSEANHTLALRRPGTFDDLLIELRRSSWDHPIDFAHFENYDVDVLAHQLRTKVEHYWRGTNIPIPRWRRVRDADGELKP